MVVFQKQSCHPPLLLGYGRQRIAVIAIVMAHLFPSAWWMPIAHGQPTTTENPAPLITDGLIQSNQRTWVIGKDGRPMLNITIQELQEMEQRDRKASELPVHLSTASLSLQIVDSVVDIQAQFSIDSPGDNVVRRFDLKMDNCQLIEIPQFSSDQQPSGEIGNRLIPSEEGYRWLHRSALPSKHAVRLDAKCLVAENSDRRNLAVELPQAITTLEIHLPTNSVEERVRNEDLIESRTVDEKGVHLKVRSRGGSFALGWRQSTAQAQVAAVEARCDTLFEPVDLLDATQFWSATSTLSIRWYGNQANNKVQILLPQGGQWSSLPYSELDRFRLTTLMPSDSNSVEVLEIENLDPTEYPVVENLKLQWRWLPQDQLVDRFSTRLKLSVPQIRGADSNEGNIELVYPNSFQTLFQEGPGVRFVQQSRISNLVGRQQMLFQYQGQTASIDLTFRKEQFQPVIRPTYRVHVYENKLELTAWYKCAFDGNNTEVGLIPGDWTIDEDSACRLIDENSPDSQESQPLSVQKMEDGSFILSSPIPDVEAEETRVEQLWRIVAWRNYSLDDNGAIKFQLPKFDRGRSIGQPVIDHGSGALLVSRENYLLLQSDEANSIGLLRDSFSSEYSAFALPQFRQPIAYRFQKHGGLPMWQGQVRLLPRQISAEQTAEIDVQNSRVQIKQDFQLQVANRSLTELRISLHEHATPVAASASGFSLSFDEVASQAGSPSAGWRTYQLAGMPELLGNSQLTITSSIPWKRTEPTVTEELAVTTTARVDVPLAQLAVDELQSGQSSRWSVLPSSSFDIKSIEPLERLGDNSFELPSGLLSVRLAVQEKPLSQTAKVVTRGTWLQTILNGTERRDRFVARVRSRSKQISIQLPGQAQLDRVAVDGKQLSSDAAPYDYSTRQAIISLADDQDHTVEVLYVLTEPLNNSITSLQLNSAEVIDARPQERFYWQLITPDVFHLGWCPSGLTAEWRWRWNLISWNRVSDEDQVSLEQLHSAATLARLPASTNSYVMSGWERPAQVEVWVLSRFVLWLPVGAITILLTMSLLNFAFLRSPTSLILMCAGLASMALLWPDFSILLGQAAVASVGLVALIWITQAAVQSRVRRRSVFSTRPITSTDISDQHSVTRSVRSQGNLPSPSPANTD
jgi:hypothetical protein